MSSLNHEFVSEFSNFTGRMKKGDVFFSQNIQNLWVSKSPFLCFAEEDPCDLRLHSSSTVPR